MAIGCGIHVAHRLTVAVIPGVQQGRYTMPQITELCGEFIVVSPDKHHEARDIWKQIGTTSAILRLMPFRIGDCGWQPVRSRLITYDLLFRLTSPSKPSAAHLRAFQNSGLGHLDWCE